MDVKSGTKFSSYFKRPADKPRDSGKEKRKGAEAQTLITRLCRNSQ